MKTILVATVLSTGFVGAAASQQLPPIRQLGPVASASSETFGALLWVRHLKNGVLVNDVGNRRLLHFDHSLSKFSVVADTTPATASAYSGRSAGLIPYTADSTLFVDAQSLSMLVIDPDGKVARVMSVPRSQDAGALANSIFGNPGFDAKGRLVYRGMPRPQMPPPLPGGGFQPPQPPDSVPVVGVTLATRQVDTVGWTLIPKVKVDVQRDDNGRVSISMVANPLPVVDDWAVLSDGSVAFIRGRDYHIDWVRPDGSRESSPKIPFEWKRLSDEEKVAFIDSVKAARERMAATAAATGQTQIMGDQVRTRADGPGAGRQLPPREGGQQIIVGGGPGAGGPGAGGPMGGLRAMAMVEPSELPDYQPPFFANSARADAEGHLWIRTMPTKALAGGPVYDVINTRGELVDRVQVPKDRLIVGFGPGGIVYLAVRESGATTTKLEKATYTK